MIKKKPNGYWTKERCQKKASKYTNKTTFRKKDGSAYQFAYLNNFLDYICSHMLNMRQKKETWTKEKCQIESLKYNTKVEFMNGSSGAYGACIKNKWLKALCSHMISGRIKPRKWTKEKCQIESLKYNNKIEFADGSSGAYWACKKNKWIDEICAHMKPLRVKSGTWTKENCQIEALKCSNMTEFENNYSGACQTAKKNKWIDEICAHMKPLKVKNGTWTKENCQSTALLYETRFDFKQCNNGCYTVSTKNGWLDEICSHMLEKRRVTKSIIISFIKSSLPELTNLDSFELINIISLNNLTSGLNKIGFLNDLTTSNPNSKERNAVLNNILSTLDNVSETIFDDVVSNNKTNDEIINTVEIKEQYEQSDLNELQTYNPIDIHYLDNVVLTKSFETDTLEFLMEYSLKKVWNSVLNDISTIDKLKNEIGGERFTIIKNWFFEEYNQVVNIQIPNDYIFTHQPNLMQKLIAYRLISRKRYGNWSGTGAGKTLSAILAGRIAGVKNTIIICNNATVKGWVETINESFKDNKIYTKTIIEGIDSNLYQAIGKSVVFNSTENNYFVLNYETFQQIDSENIIINLVNNNNIEYIVLDEVQMVKQRGDDESKRRNLINKIITNAELKNPDLLVLAMSATPITNNLTEPKKLIELLTSKSHDELNDVDNISNGIEMHKILTKHGLRYKPNYHIETVPHLIQIDGSHLAYDILNIKKSKGSSATLEKILLDTKLDGIKGYIKKGTLLYTYYTTDIITKIGTYVSNLGFSVGYYTGEDKSGLEAFKKGKLDVLIGSSPVGTGVDGIQKVCNRIIPLILPWTAAEYQQLIGRVIRQGSKFKKVDIFIPQVVISKGDDEIWSWDKIRYDIIERKKTLSDLVIDGSIPTKVLPSHEKLVEDAKKELEIWIKKIEYSDEDLTSPIRQELFTSMNPVLIEMKNQRNSELMEFNRKGKTTKSSTMHKEFKDNPDSWHRYHALRNDRISEWGEIPYEYIATKIKRTKDKIVDFGCGENKFKLCVPNNEVISFDHIAIDSSVIACDMKDVSNYLSDASVDVAVFSLALWGTNYKDYIKEAHRVLDYKGVIYIAEPISSYETKESEQNLIDLVENVGFELVGDIERRNKFIYIKGIKM